MSTPTGVGKNDANIVLCENGNGKHNKELST